ncbi:major facilitator superfamily domain-containing protein [Hypoxylon trugodes]|uniref:major facilitator superfamily domain-containing protein n=1 Tax=Hypoxylon trugodes TaxID=326681 RepID=UPI002191F019|nr:major facilitator superfamily domain-containing protein [Hypoxylon trugodes]KAI1389670.1 major facilitator superfamily domain-containing protein [Hypoxylon trugodes]
MSRWDMAERDGGITDTEDEHKKDEDENHDYLQGFQLFAVVACTTLVFFLLMLDTSILTTAIPRITSDFHSLADVGWYGAAFQLVSAVLQPLTGKFYARLNTKWTFLVFFTIFEAGSLICGLANSSPMLIGGRAIAGLGAAGLQNGGLILIGGVVPLEKRPIYTGIMMGIGQMGIISGPLIGGALTEYTTWRWCFYINLPLGGIAGLFMAFSHIPDHIKKERVTFATLREMIPHLDLPGFVLFAGAAIMFLLALEWGGSTYAWNSANIIGLFSGAGVMAILFVAWEYHAGEEAMIPGSILKKRIVWTSCLYYFSLTTTLFVSSQYLPIYFQGVKGAGPTMSGVDLLPGILTQVLFVLVSGAAVTKMGYYLPWATFGAALTSIGCGLLSTLAPTTSTGKWVGYQMLSGAGRGSGLQMGMIAVQNAVPPSLLSVSMSILVLAQNFAASIFLAVSNAIFTVTLSSEIVKNAPSVSPAAALDAGGSAAGVRALVPGGGPELDGVLLSFSTGVDRCFDLLAGLAAVAVFISLGLGWKDTRSKKPVDKGQA